MNDGNCESQRALERIHDVWPYLRTWRRWTLFARAMRYAAGFPEPLPMPLRLSMTACLATFALLLVMPQDPVAIPAAFGGGVSVATLLSLRFHQQTGAGPCK